MLFRSNYMTEIAVKYYGYDVEVNTSPKETELKFDRSGNILNNIIPSSSLPTQITSFLTKYFPGQSPSFVDKDKSGWKIFLGLGYEIEFSLDTIFTGIDGGKNVIPVSLIEDILPKNLIAYLESAYSNYYVTDIDIENYGYEIKLNNGIELDFDWMGNILSR